MKQQFDEEPQAVVVTRGMTACYTALNFDVRQTPDGRYEAESVVVTTRDPLSKDDYPAIVTAIIRSRYSADEMEAVSNSYMSNVSDMVAAAAFTEMQRWRGKAKEVAREVVLGLFGAGDEGRTDAVRELVAQRISNYGISDNVDAFLVNGVKYWMPKTMRESLVMTLGELQKAGLADFPFVLGGRTATLPCSAVSAMVTQVEVYATQCMAVTQRHLNAVTAINDEEQLLEYDFTQGYPSMPTFQIPFDEEG